MASHAQVQRGSGSGGGSAGPQLTVLACDNDLRPEATSALAWRMRQAVSDAVLEPTGPALVRSAHGPARPGGPHHGQERQM